MDYRQVKLITGCALPAAAFFVTAAVVFIGLFTSETGYGFLTVGAPLLLGLCAAIVVMFVVAPINRRLMVKNLKEGGSERLAAWKSEDPPMEFYVGPDGAWLDGTGYYWGGSLSVALEDVLLKRESGRSVLVLKLSETLDKSPRYFDVEVPVPYDRELEAENLVRKLLECNIILDENMDRKT